MEIVKEKSKTMKATMTEEEKAIIPSNFTNLVNNNSIRWGFVFKTKKTGRIINMYDITVKDYKNLIGKRASRKLLKGNLLKKKDVI